METFQGIALIVGCYLPLLKEGGRSLNRCIKIAAREACELIQLCCYIFQRFAGKSSPLSQQRHGLCDLPSPFWNLCEDILERLAHAGQRLISYAGAPLDGDHGLLDLLARLGHHLAQLQYSPGRERHLQIPLEPFERTSQMFKVEHL